jgi:hypothetical protein
MKDLYGHRRYIAAQGPIDESLVDFFHMIWQLRIISIICTANDVEAGRVQAFLLLHLEIYTCCFFSLNFVGIGLMMKKNLFKLVPIISPK